MKRVDYWQAIRGICIIAVIMIHCPSALECKSSASLFSWTVVRSMVNFPVSVFLFLSGYFASSYKKYQSYVGYIAHRSRHLIIPYAIWSCLYVILSSVVKHESVSLTDFFVLLFTGRAIGPFYYFIVLFQLTLLTPLFMFLVERKSKFIYVFYLLQLIMLIADYIYAFTTSSVPYFCHSLFFIWVCFYVLGIQLRAINESEDNYPLIRNIVFFLSGSPVILLVAFVINWLEMYVLIQNNITPHLAASQCRIGGYLYSLVLISFIFRNRKMELQKIFKTFFVYVGNISYGIFLFHIIAIGIASMIISRVLPNSSWCISYFCVFFLASLISILFVSGVRHVCKGDFGRMLLRAIGFD